MSAADVPSITLSQIFLLSATFSHRGEPLSFPVGTPHKPQRINVQFMLRDLNAGAAAQVLIKVSSDPAVGEEALYDFAVEMTAIVGKGPDGADVPAPQVLLEVGSSLLFPFVREAVANLTGRGRFGPVWLNPFNVRAAIQAQEAVITTQVPVPATS
jgi:preprotein translocase subunit SecB